MRPKHVDVWPENWPACRLFVEMGTQWRRAGMSGVKVGLDYRVLFTRMDRLGLSGEAWEAMFADIRHMEGAALDAMSEGNDG